MTAPLGTSLPPWLEEPDIGALPRMLRGGGMVQAQTKAGARRDPKTAIVRINLRWEVDKRLNPRISKVVEMLDIGDGRSRDGQVDVGHGANGTTHVVRSH